MWSHFQFFDLQIYLFSEHIIWANVLLKYRDENGKVPIAIRAYGHRTLIWLSVPWTQIKITLPCLEGGKGINCFINWLILKLWSTECQISFKMYCCKVSSISFCICSCDSLYECWTISLFLLDVLLLVSITLLQWF